MWSNSNGKLGWFYYKVCGIWSVEMVLEEVKFSLRGIFKGIFFFCWVYDEWKIN